MGFIIQYNAKCQTSSQNARKPMQNCKQKSPVRLLEDEDAEDTLGGIVSTSCGLQFASLPVTATPLYLLSGLRGRHPACTGATIPNVIRCI